MNVCTTLVFESTSRVFIYSKSAQYLMVIHGTAFTANCTCIRILNIQYARMHNKLMEDT